MRLDCRVVFAKQKLLAKTFFLIFFIPLTLLAEQAKDQLAIVFPLMAPTLSSNFGKRFHPIRKFTTKHQGVDLAAPENAHVRSIIAGKVVFAGVHKGYGKLITIEHEHGYASLYGHLSEIKVTIGQTVFAGTLIGRVGSTGMSTGPHLHFEWRKDGVAVDPLKVFPSLAANTEG